MEALEKVGAFNVTSPVIIYFDIIVCNDITVVLPIIVIRCTIKVIIRLNLNISDIKHFSIPTILGTAAFLTLAFIVFPGMRCQFK